MYLVLTRELDESVMIGDDIEVKVIDLRGGKVRLGFRVPKHIPVNRKEVYDAIRREQAKAVTK
jgi:carbon storage regulator